MAFLPQTTTPSFAQPIAAVRPRADRKILAAVVPTSRQDPITGRLWSLGANGSLVPTAKGLSIRGGGNAVASLPLDLSAYGAITVIGVISVDSWKTSDGQFDMLWELTADGGANEGGLNFYNAGGDGVNRGLVTAHYYGGGNNTIIMGSSSRPSTGVPHVYTVSYDFSRASTNEEILTFIDGVFQTVTGNGGSARSDSGKYANSTLHLLCRNQASLGTTGNLLGLVVLGHSVYSGRVYPPRTPEQFFAEYFAPVRRNLVFFPGAGSTYTDTLSESLTLAESLSSVLTALNSLSEAVTAGASESSVGTLSNSVSESVTPGDADADIGTLGNAVSETVTLGDAVSPDAAAYSEALTEATTLAQSLAEALTAANSLSEGITAGAVFADTVTKEEAIAFAATLADSLATQLDALGALSQSVGVAADLASQWDGTDLISQAVTLAGQVSDSLAGLSGALYMTASAQRLAPHTATARRLTTHTASISHVPS